MKHQVLFHLKDRNSDRETPIFLFFHWNKKRLKLSTGLKAHPRYWDAERQQLKRGVAHEGVINQALRSFAAMVESGYLDFTLRNRRDPSVEEMKLLISGNQDKHDEQNDSSANVVEAYESYVASNPKKLRPNTLKGHRNIINHLKKIVEIQGRPLTFDSLSKSFYETYENYLLDVLKVTNPSLRQVMGIFRSFLAWAYDNDLTTNNTFMRYKMKRYVKGQRPPKPYLNRTELGLIEKLDLSNDAELDAARDLLLFEADTGVRFGDLLKLSKVNVRGDLLNLTTQKNSKDVHIPLSKRAVAIWGKYDGELPRIPMVKQNEYIKELGKRAGIETPIRSVTYRGSERIEEVIPKYKALGTHSLKRSFVTNLRTANASVESIMAVTGNTRNTIENYIVVTDEEAVEEVRRIVQGNAA